MQLDNYVDVPSRLRMALADHPDLRVVEDLPQIITIGDRIYLQASVTVFRGPDDPIPTSGIAWEPWPGKTSFTRDSEMMNAATSALGRALGYMGYGLATSIASREEVMVRQQAQERPQKPATAPQGGSEASQAQLGKIAALLTQIGLEDRQDKLAYIGVILGREVPSSKSLTKKEAHKVIEEATAALAEEARNG